MNSEHITSKKKNDNHKCIYREKQVKKDAPLGGFTEQILNYIKEKNLLKKNI